MEQNKKSLKTMEKYWYFVEAILLLLAVIYFMTFIFGNINIAMYSIIAFGLASIGAAILMMSQKHYLTMFINAIFALVIVLHYIYYYYQTLMAV